jgi:hypothetical protein
MSSIPKVLDFSVYLILPTTLEFGETLIETIPRIFLGVKGPPSLKADNFIAICEPVACGMWKPRRLTTLWASTACYGDSFTLWRRSVLPVRYALDCKYCYK